jgi:hypothetical protein
VLCVCCVCVLCALHRAVSYKLGIVIALALLALWSWRIAADCCLLLAGRAMCYANVCRLCPMSHVPCQMPVIPAVSSTYPVYPETENREKTGNGGGAGYFLLRNLKRAEPVHTAHVHDVPRASCSHFALFMCFFGGWWHTDLPLASQLPTALALNAWPRWTLPPPPPAAHRIDCICAPHCALPLPTDRHRRPPPLAAGRHPPPGRQPPARKRKKAAAAFLGGASHIPGLGKWALVVQKARVAAGPCL